MSGQPTSIALLWRCIAFAALSPAELYRVLQLRTEVFVMEQNCVFQDMDGADVSCLHLMGETEQDNGEPHLMAYARLVPAGLKFPEASIGRVATAAKARGTGAGHVLMREAVCQLHRCWGEQPIRIGAQAHLQAFYRQHRFEPQGDLYIEDGIDHVEMIRR